MACFACCCQECAPGRHTAPPAVFELEEIGHSTMSCVFFLLWFYSFSISPVAQCEYGIAETLELLLQLSLSYLISAIRWRVGCICYTELSMSESKLKSYLDLTALQCVQFRNYNWGRGFSLVCVGSAGVLQWERINIMFLYFFLWKLLHKEAKLICLLNKLIIDLFVVIAFLIAGFFAY